MKSEESVCLVYLTEVKVAYVADFCTVIEEAERTEKD